MLYWLRRLLKLVESGLSPPSCLVYFEGKPGMIVAGRLARDVHGLKELLRVAWKELANPLLTPFERREARNQIERCGVELQRHLKLMEAERSRYRKRSLEENDGRSFSKPKLRLLAGGL
jgi:hypothetical protein